MLDRRNAIATMLGVPTVVATGRWIQSSGPFPTLPRRRVIISSDDAGMCQAVNNGTIQGLTHGIVTSASIMTCCPAFEQFAEFASQHPHYDYGVHLTLTCDLREQPWGPVSSIEEVPSLIDDQAYFPMWPSQKINVDEAEKELRAQIDKAIAAGIRITHIDHHMWVMFHNEELLQLYLRLGLDYGIPLRLCRREPSMIARRGERMKDVYQEQIALAEQHGLPILDHIEYQNYSVSRHEKREYFLNYLRSLPSGVSEIAIHCSTGDPVSPPDVQARIGDLIFFTSVEASECLISHATELTRWNRIRRTG